jgi:hypothetical protein
VLSLVGRYETAAVLVGALRGPLTMVLIPAYEADDRRAAINRLRERLGVEAYELAVGRGSSMTYEEVVEFVLTTLDRALAEAPPPGPPGRHHDEPSVSEGSDP